MVSHGTITNCVIVDAHADEAALYFADGAFRTLITATVLDMTAFPNSDRGVQKNANWQEVEFSVKNKTLQKNRRFGLKKQKHNYSSSLIDLSSLFKNLTTARATLRRARVSS